MDMCQVVVDEVTVLDDEDDPEAVLQRLIPSSKPTIPLIKISKES